MSSCSHFSTQSTHARCGFSFRTDSLGSRTRGFLSRGCCSVNQKRANERCEQWCWPFICAPASGPGRQSHPAESSLSLAGRSRSHSAVGSGWVWLDQSECSAPKQVSACLCTKNSRADFVHLHQSKPQTNRCRYNCTGMVYIAPPMQRCSWIPLFVPGLSHSLPKLNAQ